MSLQHCLIDSSVNFLRQELLILFNDKFILTHTGIHLCLTADNKAFAHLFQILLSEKSKWTQTASHFFTIASEKAIIHISQMELVPRSKFIHGENPRSFKTLANLFNPRSHILLSLNPILIAGLRHLFLKIFHKGVNCELVRLHSASCKKNAPSKGQ